MRNQNGYLRQQLGDSMKQTRNEVHSSPSFISSESAQGEGDEDENNSGGSSSGELAMRCPRRDQPNLKDIRVEVSEYERRLDCDERVLRVDPHR